MDPEADSLHRLAASRERLDLELEAGFAKLPPELRRAMLTDLSAAREEVRCIRDGFVTALRDRIIGEDADSEWTHFQTQSQAAAITVGQALKKLMQNEAELLVAHAKASAPNWLTADWIEAKVGSEAQDFVAAICTALPRWVKLAAGDVNTEEDWILPEAWLSMLLEQPVLHVKGANGQVSYTPELDKRKNDRDGTLRLIWSIRNEVMFVAVPIQQQELANLSHQLGLVSWGSPAIPDSHTRKATVGSRETKRERDDAICRIRGRRKGDIDYKLICVELDRQRVPPLPSWPEKKTWLANLQSEQDRDRVRKYIHDVIKPPRKKNNPAAHGQHAQGMRIQ